MGYNSWSTQGPTGNKTQHEALWLAEDDILQTIFSNEFSWMRIFVYWFEFHWILFPIIQLITMHHWVQIMTWCRPLGRPLFEPIMAWFNTLRPRQNGCHFSGNILKCIFVYENVWISIKISLKFVPSGPINNISVSVQIMAWYRQGDMPLSEPMVVSLLMHICVTVNMVVVDDWELFWQQDIGNHHDDIGRSQHAKSVPMNESNEVTRGCIHIQFHSLGPRAKGQKFADVFFKWVF